MLRASASLEAMVHMLEDAVNIRCICDLYLQGRQQCQPSSGAREIFARMSGSCSA